jgi:Ca2+-binding RTX toxin-like protein
MLIDTLEQRRHLSAGPITTAARTISGTVFQSAVALPPFADPVRNAMAGDFNSDGNLDLAVVSGTGTGTAFNGGVTVLLNRGNGTFARAASFALSELPTSLAVGNFTFDRQLDLVVSTGNGAAVLTGNGDGSFSGSVPLVAHDAGVAGGGNLAVGDFNADGRLDVATSGFHFLDNPQGNQTTESQIAVFMGGGNGTFFGPTFTRIAGNRDLSIATVRANRDSIADLAVGARNQVKLLTGKGDGTFNFPAVLAASNPTFLRTADVNSDGRADLLWRDGDDTFFALGLRRSRGFSAPRRVSPSSAAAAVGDFNGDRLNDLVLEPTGGAGRILLGRPGGTYTLVTDPVRANPGIPGVVGDFNGDGRDDVLSADFSRIFFAGGPRAFLDGAGTLRINGTRRSDNIAVTNDGAAVRVTVNGQSFDFSFFDIEGIRISGGRGNDVITVAAGLNKAVFASGGAGDDRITTGVANDTLDGGDGNDVLVGGLGDDLLHGGVGADDVAGGVGNDSIFGDAGIDRFHVTDNNVELKDRAANESAVV